MKHQTNKSPTQQTTSPAGRRQALQRLGALALGSAFAAAPLGVIVLFV